MSILLSGCFSNVRLLPFARGFSCSPALKTKEWRMSKGLPLNRNAEGFLTDGPDYTFLDGRPTPLLHKQKLRHLKHQETASRIVSLCSELQCAKQRHADILKAKEEERQKYIDNLLKPKGDSKK